jgi:hypothetical protein
MSNNISLSQNNINYIEKYDDLELDYQESSLSPSPEVAKEVNSIGLELGDIILIKDPTNEILNNNIFFIDYIDTNKIKLINEKDLKPIELKIHDNIISDGTISDIELLYRNEQKGYARQNDLLTGKWINIYFGGDIPTIITGEITNLEEDMIEIKLLDESTIYINFDYKGLPEELPIENIEIRPAPTSSVSVDKVLELGEGDALEELEQENLPVIQQTNIRENIKKSIIEADQIEFGEYLNPIKEFVDIDKEKYRYNIDAQTNDLLDELLSTVPNNQRTPLVLNNIHIMITRFLQLREIGSIFDKNKNVISIIKKDANDKPLAEYLGNFKNTLYWIMIVAQNIKKVYNVETADLLDVTSTNIFDSLHTMENIFNNFKSNVSSESINKYNNLYSDLDVEMTPFISIGKEQTNNVICEHEVETNMNIVINNLGDFNSSQVKNNNIASQRFVIQKYNLGLDRLKSINMKGGNMITHLIKLTKNDELSVNSILTLPEPTIKFSQINLPGCNIFDKSNLNLHFLNYWELLKKNTIVNTVEIDDLNVELNYDSGNFVDNIKNYTLNMDLNNNNKNNQEIYKDFLKIIVPKIRVLFQLVKKYIKGKLSFVNLISYLEPFLVYPNDLTYMQYVEINKFIREKISEYNKQLIENGRKMAILKSIPTQKNYLNILLDILNSNSEIKHTVLEKYGYNGEEINKPRTDSEILKNIILKDYGNLYNTAVAFENISLMFPNELNSIFELDKDKLNHTFLKDSENNKCNNYIISKKYYTKQDLDNDNGKIIYFDKEYDNSPYYILDNFSKEQHSLTSDEFSIFLSDKLQSKYKYKLEDAEYISDTLVNGFKKVKDGHYAILIDETNKNDIKYFMRNHNQWIEDNKIDKDLFLNESESLCLVQPDCLFIEENGSKNLDGTCESIQMNKDTVVSNALNKILNEFDKKYEITNEEFKNKLNKYLERFVTIFEKLENIHKFNFYKYNNIQYDLGLQVNENISEIISPYLKLRDLILGQSDYVKKQNDILQFCSKFTRSYKENEPDILSGELESSFWLYCKKTNTKLLPTFLYKLAKVFIQNPNLFNNTMNNIIKDQGSEDGDKIVDKYSGYVIKSIDWDTEEGYEEGFKIVSREVMEEDLGQTIITNAKLKKKFLNPQAQIINNIVSSLSSFMGINLDEQNEFIIQIVTNLISDSNILEPEQKYNKRMEEMIKKGKKLPEYKFVYNSTFLYLTLGMYLIAVQTSIPSIRSRKTFPGCVRSFTGFPIQGEGEYSGLNYLACVVYKLKSPSAPWYVLQRIKEDTIAEKIKAFTVQYLLSNQEVNQKIKHKLEYLLLNPEEEIPIEHSLQKWINFLPPLTKFKIKGLQNVSDGFINLLLQDIRSGSNKQTEQLLVIQSKIIQFSLAIQEIIQKIVEKKELLLKNSIHPYMDNACCNEQNKGSIVLTTLQYFINENNEIYQYNNIVKQLSDIVNDINSLTESCMYLSKVNTKRFYPSLPIKYTESTIYQTFIKYCNFNNLLPIDLDLFALCKDKPDNLSLNDSMEEKIIKLKRDGRNYTEEGLLRLIQIVSRHNIVETVNDITTYTPIQKLRDLTELIDKTNDETIAPSFINLLNNLVDTYDTTVTSDTENMRKMKNYLETSNNKMRKQLLDFIKQKGKIRSADYNKIYNFIKNIGVWDSDNSTRNESSKISDDAMYNYIQFYKTFISMLSKVYPNMILNKTMHSINVPKYWGLSKNHTKEVKKMVESYYTSIEKFYGKTVLNNVLLSIQEKTKNILLFANETPTLTSIQKDGEKIYSVFDKRTSSLLYEYYLLQIFTSYIDMTDNPLMIKKTIPEHLNRGDNLFETEEDIQLETVEPDYISGDINDLKENIASLLVAYIKVMNNVKDTINISYEKVMDRVFKLREKEKDTFTDRLRDLTDEAREVDTILKINKLGTWNKGLTKGLKEYDPENYDQEKIVLQKVTELERKIRNSNSNINDSNIDIIMDDYLEDMENVQQEENEERNINNMSEDYMDGYDYNEIEDVDEGEYY